MSVPAIVCPTCGGRVQGDITVCPDCQEDLSALVRLEYEHAIRYNEALALAQEGDRSGARKKLYQSLAARESFALAHALLAKIDALDGRWSEARDSVARALDLRPDDRELMALAKDIEAEAARSAQSRQEDAALRKKRAERLIASLQRDAARAFLAGIGLASVVAMLIGWLRGAGKGDDEW